MNKREILQALQRREIDVPQAKHLLAALRAQGTAAPDALGLMTLSRYMRRVELDPLPHPSAVLLICDAPTRLEALPGMQGRIACAAPIAAAEQQVHAQLAQSDLVLLMPAADSAVECQHGLQSAFRWMQLLSRHPGKRVLVACHGRFHEVLSQGIAGIVQVLRAEYPEAAVTVVHTESCEVDAVARALHGVVERDTRPYIELSLANDVCHRPILVENLQPSADGHARLRENGVYLLTGGAGGIGLQIARHLRQAYRARLILVGRSPLSERLRRSLDDTLGAYEYLSVDVADEAQVVGLMAEIAARHGELHGVIHAAGVLDDGYLIRQDVSRFASVLAPKLLGAAWLDRHSRRFALDFFAVCASMATYLPNQGQATYAAANRAMSAIAAMRRAAGAPGRTLGLHWPLWDGGRMGLSAAESAAQAEAFGIHPMPVAIGVQTLEDLLASAESERWYLFGERPKLERVLTGAEQAVSRPAPAHAAAASAVDEIVAWLVGAVAEATEIAQEKIHPDQRFDAYGLDSLMINRLNAMLASRFSGVAKTVFFEYPSIRALARHLSTRPQQAPAAARAESTAIDDTTRPASGDAYQAPGSTFVPVASRDIAIVGVAGRYPGAETIDALAALLNDGRDCIGEIPRARWPLVDFWSDSPSSSSLTAGGYLDDIEQFDPFFFGISPRDAENIDPQERLFLQTVWHALENGGYGIEKLHARSLSRDALGQARHRVGVYVGIAAGQYSLLVARHHHDKGAVCAQSSSWSVANRVSYFLDLHGPSLAIDTACSSSLSALEIACKALRDDDVAIAIVGGVSLNLDPLRNRVLEAAHMLSADRRCRSFGIGGTGFVPGEGVAAIVLRRLADAERDQDNILGVIKACRLNHGGRTNGYTVPSPAAHANLIAETLAEAGVGASDITYVEAHGTGTQLGDPIELDGLNRALGVGAESERLPPCAIGSIKSNIGHLEPAAALAGLTKILLQFQRAAIFPSLHSRTLNPALDIERTRFVVPQSTTAWPAGPDGRRVAALSSFGAGGSNGHLIVEHDERFVRAASAPDLPVADAQLFLLSAMTRGRLVALAQAYVEWLRARIAEKRLPAPAALATLLRSTRTALDCRLAIVARDYDELIAALESFLARQETQAWRYRCMSEHPLAARSTMDVAEMMALIRRAAWSTLADRWLDHGAIPWHEEPAAPVARGLRLPLYPFERRRCWFHERSAADHEAPSEPAAVARAYPIEHRIERGADGRVRVTFRLDADEPLIGEHRVNARIIVAGTLQLELVRAAAVLAGMLTEPAPLRFRDVILASVLSVEKSCEVTIALAPDGQNGFAFEVTTDAVHSRGRIAASTEHDVAPDDVVPVVGGDATQSMTGEALYRLFAQAGYDYGELYRGIESASIATDACTATLRRSLPTALHAERYRLMQFHPAIVDAGLQSIALLNTRAELQFLPFACREIRVDRPAAAVARAVATRRPGKREDEQRFDVHLLDQHGCICITYVDFCCRALPRRGDAASISATNLYRPLWQAHAVKPVAAPQTVAPALVLAPPHESQLVDALVAALGEGNVRRIDVSRSCDWDAMEQALRRIGGMRLRIFHCVGVADRGAVARDQTSDPLDRHALHSLFHLSKRLFNLSDQAIELTIVTDDVFQLEGDEPANLASSTLAGFTKSLSRELVRAKVAMLDFSSADIATMTATARRAYLAKWLATELPSLPESAVAIRKDVAYTETFEPVAAAAVAIADVLRTGGTYLIVGGTGGLGSATAKFLVERFSATVILVGRRAAPHGLVQLPESGRGGILHYRADITSEKDMQRLARDIEADYGRIDGIFHSAIALRDVSVRQMSLDALDEVLAPKTLGVANFFAYLAPLCRDLVVLYSSAISQNGTGGQANYAAASTFEDAYARAMARTFAARAGAPKVVLINWGFWREVGIVSDRKYIDAFARKGVAGLSTAEGLALLRLAVNGDWVQVVTGSDDVVTAAGNDLPAANRPDRRSFASSLSEFWTALDVHNIDLGFDEGIRDELQACVEERLLLTLRASGLFLERMRAFSESELIAQLAVIPQYEALLRACIAILVNAGSLERVEAGVRLSTREVPTRAAVEARIDRLVAAHADTGPILTLFRRCMDHLAAVLAGRKSYAEVMFPRGSDTLVAPLYRDNPASDLFNRVIQRGLDVYLSMHVDSPRSRPIRVLEIGAGTGGTTRWLLDALSRAGPAVEYLFTDISSSFVNAGRERFGRDHPSMSFAVLDIEDEGSIERQNKDFDVVIATNVLHATRNIDRVLRHCRALLSDTGVLMLNEACERKDIMTLTFGLSSGWWLFEDAAQRIPHSPLLKPAQWSQLLRRNGFADLQFIGDSPGSDAFGHFVCCAWADRAPSDDASNEASRPMVAAVDGASPQPCDMPAAAYDGAIADHIRQYLSELQKIPLAELSDHVGFDRYGVDSIVSLQLHDRLRAHYPSLPNEAVVQHNTIAALARHIGTLITPSVPGAADTGRERSGSDDTPPGAAASDEVRGAGGSRSLPLAAHRQTAHSASAVAGPAVAAAQDVAIVGLSGRYPGAPDLDAFWDNLAAGRTAFAPPPTDRWPASAPLSAGMQLGGYLDGIDRFDALFFHVSPRDAQRMDPQERLLIEACWSAIEDAGYTPAALNAARAGGVGVFAATMYGHYELLAADEWARNHPASASSAHYALANNVSRLMNFTGPSVTVDNACSSALTALHLAVMHLHADDCAAAIVAGVNLVLHPYHLASLEAMRMLSPRGQCRVLAADADGFVVGEGVGAILVKPLAAAEADGDHIYAVVKSTACNANGATATAVPSAAAQAEVVRRALAKSALAAADIDYIELQCTGSRLGDKAEFDALGQVFGESSGRRAHPLWIGTVKPNIGHLEAAAGLAQLTKLILQLKHGMLAKTIADYELRPDVDFAEANIQLVRETRAWPASPGRPRRAGISSFGAGGSNVHVVVEEYVPTQARVRASRCVPLFPLSARKPAILREYASRMARHLTNHPDLPAAAVAFTAQTGRVAQRFRLCIAFSDLADLREKLAAFARGEAVRDGAFGEAQEGGAATQTHALADPQPSLSALAERWVRGGAVEWAALYTEGFPGRVALPTYPYEHVRHWFERTTPTVRVTTQPSQTDESSIDEGMTRTMSNVVTAAVGAGDHAITLAEIEALVSEQVCEVLRIDRSEIRLEDPLSEYGFDSITLTELVTRFSEPYGIDIDVTVFFEHTSLQQFARFLFDQHAEKLSTRHRATAAIPSTVVANEAPTTAADGACRLTEADILRIAALSQPAAATVAAVTGVEPTLAEVRALVVREVCDVLKIDAAEVRIGDPLSEYGFDSITLTELVTRFSEPYGIDIDVTIFFEHTSLESFADFLFTQHAAKLAQPGRSPEVAADRAVHAAASASEAVPVRIAGDDASAPRPLPVMAERAVGAATVAGGNPLTLADVEALVVRQVCEVLKIDAAEIRLADPLSEYGFDSITLTELVTRFSEPYGIDIDVTIFFEHTSLASFAQFLFESHASRLAAVPTTPTAEAARTRPAVPAVTEAAMKLPVERGLAADAPPVQAPSPSAGGVREFLADQASAILNIDRSEIRMDVPLREFGFDAVTSSELVRRLNVAYGIDIDVRGFIAHPSLGSFAQHLMDHHAAASRATTARPTVISTSAAPIHVPVSTPEPSVSKTAAVSVREKDVAVIGMAGQFPGSSDLESFWQNLCEGRTAITGFPARRTEDFTLYAARQAYPEFDHFFRAGFLEDFDKFDPLFFKISPIEARTIDPQQRLLLECAWQAIEDAGYNPRSLAGSLTGVFVGVATSEYADILTLLARDDQARDFTGTLFAAHANRISFNLDLHGPSEAIDTACSSSLVATHRAVQSLRSGECELALAGGVNIILGCAAFLMFGAAGMLAKDGRCKSFDDKADGYVRGEGVGFVLLKPLAKAIEDGDNIRAVIKGTAIRHGGRAASMTSPGVVSQAELIRQSLLDAGIRAGEIGYIEAHGTGTRIGDPIEINALRRVFTDAAGTPCAIGTVKPNIGHLETAAGIAGLIKTILILERGTIPPLATLETVNSMIKLEDSRLYLPREKQVWRTGDAPRTAGVSSFGIGGVIVHQVLQQGACFMRNEAPSARRAHAYPVVLSAQSKPQLKRYCTALLKRINGDEALALHDVALTLAKGREAFAHRVAMVAASRAQLIQQLVSLITDERSDGLFTGYVERTSGAGDAGAGYTGNDAREAAEHWVSGRPVAWDVLFAGMSYRKLSLPTYPFERESVWVPGKVVLVTEEEAAARRAARAAARESAAGNAETLSQPPVRSDQATAPSSAAVSTDAADVTRTVLENLTKVFSETMHIPVDKLNPTSQFADFGVDSLSGLRIMQRLQQEYGSQLPAAAVLENPTLLDLAKFIGESIVQAESGTAAPAPADKAVAPASNAAAAAPPAQQNPQVAPTKPAGTEQPKQSRVAVLEMKRGQAQRPLLILCSAAGDLAWSMHWLNALADGQRVVGIELGGFGGSNASPATTAAFDSLADLARECADALRDVDCGDGFRLVAYAQMATLAAQLSEMPAIANRLHEVILIDPRQPASAGIDGLIEMYGGVWGSEPLPEAEVRTACAQANASPSEIALAIAGLLQRHARPPMPAEALQRWLTRAVEYQQAFTALLDGATVKPAPYAGAMTVIESGTHGFVQLTQAWPLAEMARLAIDVDRRMLLSRSATQQPRTKVETTARPSPLRPSFVTLNSAGRNENIVCFPTLYGDAGYATSLSLHLGRDYSMYAMEQWQGARPLTYPTIEALAGAFVDQLLASSVDTPYTLLGLSFGGVVAYEVCNQLQRAGRPVENLILIDPYMPNTDAFSVFGEMRLEVDGKDLNQIGLAGIIFDRWRVRQPLDFERLNHRSEEEQIDLMARHLATHSSAKLSFAAARRVIASHFAVDKANRRANTLYHPSALPEDVNTLMIMASRGFYDPAAYEGQRTANHYQAQETQVVGLSSDPTKGFRPFLRGQFRLLEFACDHLSMPLHLRECARSIDGFLRDARTAMIEGGATRPVRNAQGAIYEI